MSIMRGLNTLINKYFPKIYRCLFSRPMFYKFNKLLYLSALRGIGVLNFENDRVSGEFRFLESYFKNRTGLTVIDVGANIGNFSKKIMRIAPNTMIYSFEPHPATFIKLRETAERFGFKAFSFACGNENSTVRLYDYIDDDGSSHASLFHDVIREIHDRDAVEHIAQVIKLDDFVVQHNINEIHLLKIDTEGNELNVLLGLENFIRQGKVKVILFEFNEMNVVSRVFFRDFYKILNDEYDFFRMLPGGLAPLYEYDTVFWEIFAYQNIVAALKPRENK